MVVFDWIELTLESLLVAVSIVIGVLGTRGWLDELRIIVTIVVFFRVWNSLLSDSSRFDWLRSFAPQVRRTLSFGVLALYLILVYRAAQNFAGRRFDWLGLFFVVLFAFTALGFTFLLLEDSGWTPTRLWSRAVFHLSDRNADQALRLATLGTRVFPWSSRMWTSRAWATEQVQGPRSMEPLLRRAIARAPKNPDLWGMLLESMYTAHDAPGLTAALEEFEAKNPDAALVAYYKGLWASTRGDWEGARSELELARERAKRDFNAILLDAIVVQLLQLPDEADRAKAEAVLRSMIEQEIYDVATLVWLSVLVEKTSPTEAAQLLDQASKIVGGRKAKDEVAKFRAEIQEQFDEINERN